MNASHIMRNVITLLLVLTVANLAASYSALRAVRIMRDDSQVQIQRIDTAIVTLTQVTHRLCAEHGDTCTAVQVSTQK